MCVCVCECCKSPWMDKMCTRHTGRTIGRNTPPNVLCMRMTAVIEGRRMRYTTQPIRHWMTQQFEIMASRRANTCERYIHKQLLFWHIRVGYREPHARFVTMCTLCVCV